LPSVAGLSVAGAALLALVARHYPIDAPGACCVEPSLRGYLPYGALFLVGVALLTWAWLRSDRLRTTRGRVLAGGLAAHLVMLCGLPFLSLDSLYYEAIGRAMALGHDPHRPLSEALSPTSSLAQLLPPAWRTGTTPYLAGFNRLSETVARLTGSDVARALHLYQLLGMAAIFLCAALVGRAVLIRAGETAAARAAALILFCPLSLVEATLNGHNDALLAIPVALFALATLEKRRLLGVLALASGLLVKASALLLLGMELSRLALARLGRLVTPARVLAVGAAGAAALLTAYFVLHDRVPALVSVAALVGRPADLYEHCTRSPECLPRALLRYVFHRNTAAWALGLVFRAASAVWLFYAAGRAARAEGTDEQDSPLVWLATGLFIYYLCFHGFMQSWYLLSLLPLLPFADRRLLPFMKLFLVCAVAYYAIDLPLQNATNPVEVGIRELGGAVIADGVTLFLLIGVWLRAQSRKSAMRASVAPRRFQ
jgi:hypothetical protein